MITLRCLRLAHGRDLPLPHRATPGASGLDLCAAIDAPVILEPSQRAAIPTGLSVALPPGTEAQVRPRSGLALRHGVTVLNAPGTIDADYRGEIHVILINLGDQPLVVSRGDRIAQLVCATVAEATLVEVDDLDQTERGSGGFGSTGVAGARE
jgi:dUTP pyrophosphatase